MLSVRLKARIAAPVVFEPTSVRMCCAVLLAPLLRSLMLSLAQQSIPLLAKDLEASASSINKRHHHCSVCAMFFMSACQATPMNHKLCARLGHAQLQSTNASRSTASKSGEETVLMRAPSVHERRFAITSTDHRFGVEEYFDESPKAWIASSVTYLNLGFVHILGL